MSRVEHVTYTCDREDGDVPATRHRLTLNGITVEIDLCDDHLAVIAGYVLAGRKATRPGVRRRSGAVGWRPPAAPKGGQPAAQRRYTLGIRTWAVENGLLEPGSVGRLPGDVVAKYEDAHGGAR